MVSPTLPNSPPLSLRCCLSRSLSASLASFSVCLLLAFWAASSPAAPFLCWAWPSAFLSSSPVTAPAASFILPLAFSSIVTPSWPPVRAALVGSALVGRTGHVLDGDATSGAHAFYLRDVHPEVLRPAFGGGGGCTTPFSSPASPAVSASPTTASSETSPLSVKVCSTMLPFPSATRRTVRPASSVVSLSTWAPPPTSTAEPVPCPEPTPLAISWTVWGL